MIAFLYIFFFPGVGHYLLKIQLLYREVVGKLLYLRDCCSFSIEVKTTPSYLE